MRLRVPYFFFLLTGLTALLSGCAGGGSQKAPVEISGEGFKLKSQTVALSAENGVTLVGQTDTSMTVSGAVPTMKAGDVIVSRLGDGALRKVKTVTASGGNTLITTEQAGIADAFSELNLTVNTFGKAELGDIESEPGGPEFKWVSAPPGMPTSTAAAELSWLEIDFKKVGLSAGVEFDGKSYLRLNPKMDIDFGVRPGDILPSFKSFDIGVSPEIGGTLTISSKYGGSIELGEKTWLNKRFKPIVYGYVVLVPHLKITSTISGVANGKFNSTYTLDSYASALYHWDYIGGLVPNSTKSSTRTARVDDCDATFGVNITPLRVEFSWDVYGIVGPFIAGSVYFDGEGAFKINEEGLEGVQATIEGGLRGEAGISTGFEDIIDLDLTFAKLSIDIPLVTLFDHFFPFKGTGSIVVADNGPAPDDIFEVSLDGSVLGRTALGGSGQFRVNSLRPGNHNLTLLGFETGIDGDIGTFGITLADGITFADGSTSKSGTMLEGETVSFVIVVPESGTSRRVLAPPMPRNTARERTR